MMITKENRKSLVSLKLWVRKLQRRVDNIVRSFVSEEEEDEECVSDDVKEGHFVVVAAENEEPIRFVMDLCVLKHPEFLQLLKLAEEEYGFQQKRAIFIPCRPDDLTRILQDK